MGIHFELVSHDELYDKLSASSPVVLDYEALQHNPNLATFMKNKKMILNDMNTQTEKDKQVISQSIYSKYNSDVLKNLPSCECGGTVGRYNLGVICDMCHTEVVEQSKEELDPVTWIRTPKGIPALMNPFIWKMLSDRFTISGFNVFKWLVDTTYQPEKKGVAPAGLTILQTAMDSLGIKRGYISFYDHFDELMDTLFNIASFKKGKHQIDFHYELIKKERNKIFNQFMPIPNKVLLVIERTNFGTYIDKTIINALEAITTMAGIDSEIIPVSIKRKEHRTVKALDYLSRFYSDVTENLLTQKTGIMRRHIFGSRAHFSFRNVISSITKPHEYDECHIPWTSAINVFRPHILNKLSKRGYVPKEALRIYNSALIRYVEVIDEIFKELIAESVHIDPLTGEKKVGISVLANRNPSLKIGSTQALRITKVKTDPEDVTVGISILIVVPLNADKHCVLVSYVGFKHV